MHTTWLSILIWFTSVVASFLCSIGLGLVFIWLLWHSAALGPPHSYHPSQVGLWALCCQLHSSRSCRWADEWVTNWILRLFYPRISLMPRPHHILSYVWGAITSHGDRSRCIYVCVWTTQCQTRILFVIVVSLHPMERECRDFVFSWICQWM